MSSVSNVNELPRTRLLLLIVKSALANLLFVIEPANISLVIPNAFTLKVSELISTLELSTLTVRVTSPEEPPPDRPSPATTLVISPICPSMVNVPALSS